jgi:hypothetical protein
MNPVTDYQSGMGVSQMCASVCAMIIETRNKLWQEDS